jgi:glycosyltransferase involved in cell wall biosynthesis
VVCTFDVVIPTYCRPELLLGLLRSIDDGIVPSSLGRVIVVENGHQSGAQDICALRFNNIQPIYVFVEQAGLSGARNCGARLSTEDVILFLDDDLKLSSDTLNAYSVAFARDGSRAFYGGPLTPDYESAPKECVLSLLPHSVTGFSLGDHDLRVDEPILLGGNFAIGRSLLAEHGGFDGVSAEGRNSGGVGEETRLQERMLERGVTGIYVAGANVKHHVPASSVSFRFALRRRWRTGFGEGQLECASMAGSMRPHIFGAPPWLWRVTVRRVVSDLARALWVRRCHRSARCAAELCRHIGKLMGYRYEYRNGVHRQG